MPAVNPAPISGIPGMTGIGMTAANLQNSAAQMALGSSGQHHMAMAAPTGGAVMPGMMSGVGGVGIGVGVGAGGAMVFYPPK